jgi:hypothetical protein
MCTQKYWILLSCTYKYCIGDCNTCTYGKKKGKAIPVTGCGGL